MYKLLIVDDESKIRLGIQAMVNREFANYFNTFVAEDGVEALDVLHANHIDILITDIKMPRMDGISLIENLQDMEQLPALIILSGHDDFSYAKAAIKNRVKDYLLKPVNRKELFQTLRRVADELDSLSESANDKASEYRSSQLNYMLLNPNVTKEKVAQQCEELLVADIVGPHYYIAVIDNVDGLNGHEFLLQIQHIMEKQSNHTVSFCNKDGHVVLVASTLDVFYHLKNVLAESNSINCSIAASAPQSTYQNFKEAYEQAMITKKYQFLFPRSSLLFFEDVKEKQIPEEQPTDNINKLSNMLGTDRDKELKAKLLEIFDYDKITKLNISYMESINKGLNAKIFDVFFKKFGQEAIDLFKQYNKVSDMYQYKDFHEYYYAVEESIMRLHEYTKQLRSVYSAQNYMEQAIDYMKENFHKDLNLAVVSNHISLNYSYFSHAFKEFTGQNFVDYLKHIRINAAKKLLKETDYKISEISELVGYKNPKQFARVFKELVGVSAKEYRAP
ncbi:response regulator [Bacillus sp. HMF5848]|uniref:response regulator transcription factor n=1 Tax=Bacillus sp. HMF5848 TaxID=2495421 RepID=UPI000F7769A9|nr:response regulator [Bacillus sp. HMF5848]RSK25614.1 response regulator [Bacillus sp. HMF5848]